MIPYRPIAPLTLGPRRGWKSVVTAIVMAALLGTTATSAVAAEGSASAAAIQTTNSGACTPSVRPTEPAGS